MSHTTSRIWNAHAKLYFFNSADKKVSVTGELYLKRYDSLDSTISKSESKVDKKTIFSFKNYQNFEIPKFIFYLKVYQKIIQAILG